MAVNSLHSVLMNVFGGGGFETPPGRPLYSYRCSNENYEKIQSFLRQKSDEMGHGKKAPVFVHEAFCLYVSEWVRRNHKTGHVRWCDVLDSLNWPQLTNSTLSYLTESGLKYWNRPLRTKGNKPAYLLTLVLEGGLPLRMMEDNQGALVNYFKKVLTGIRQNTNQYVQSNEIAENYEDLLPTSLRNKTVFALAGDFCGALHDLASEADAYRTDTVNEIRKFKPDWFKQLPVVMDELGAEALARAVYSGSERSHSHQPTLKVQREWIKDDEECWYCEASYKLPLHLKHGSLEQFFDLDPASKATRLTLRGVTERDSEVIALLSKGKEQEWAVEKYPAWRNVLTGSSALKQISFELFDGTNHVGTYVPSGGVALSEELPWVLEATNEYANELRFIGVGSLSTTAESVYLAMPMSNSMLMLDPDGELGIPEILDGSDRFLVPITGNYTVRLEDGQCCVIKTGQEQEYAPHYLFGRASFKNITSKYPIFRGTPIIYKVSGNEYVRVNEAELYWRKLRSGVASWVSFSETTPIGKVEIRQVVNNEVLHSTRCVVLPEQAQIQLIANSEKSGCVKFQGFGDVTVADLHAGQFATTSTEYDNSVLVLSVSSKVPSHQPLNLRLSWPGMEPTDLTIPFPAQGCRITGMADRLRKSLTVNELFGLRAEGVQIEGGDNRFFVEIEDPTCRLTHSNQKLVKAKFEMLAEPSESIKSFNLSALQEPLKALLSNVGQNESVDLRVYGAGCNDLVVKACPYPLQIYAQENTICLSPDCLGSLEGGINFKAYALFNLGKEPLSLELSQQCVIDIDVLTRGSGAWLVCGERDGKIITNQLLYSSGCDEQLALTLVQKAFIDERAASELIQELGNSMASKSWLEFVNLLNEVATFDPRSFPIMALLSKQDHLLLGTLFHSIFKGTQDQVWDLETKLGFCWGSMPLEAWSKTIVAFEKDCTNSLGLAPQMLLMMDTPLRALSARDWRVRIGIDKVIRHISSTNNHPLISIDMVSEQEAKQAWQDLIRLVDKLPRMEGFPKSAYFSAFDGNPEIKREVMEHWSTKSYDKRVEFLVNHTLVAAALTLLDSESEQNFKLVQPLLNLVHQQAPEHLGPLFNYFQKNLVK